VTRRRDRCIINDAYRAAPTADSVPSTPLARWSSCTRSGSFYFYDMFMVTSSPIHYRTDVTRITRPMYYTSDCNALIANFKLKSFKNISRIWKAQFHIIPVS